MSEERFDPRPYMLSLKGKSYMPVVARIAAFRDECPITAGWGIRTRCLEGGREAKYALYYAEIVDPEGRVVSTGTKQEDIGGFGDFMEKAETGAIGRALGAAGFGTLFALEFDEGEERITDAPVQKAPAPPRAAPRSDASFPLVVREAPTPGKAPGPPVQANAPVCSEEGCGTVLTTGQNTVSTRVYGRALCPTHQSSAGKQLATIASRPAV